MNLTLRPMHIHFDQHLMYINAFRFYGFENDDDAHFELASAQRNPISVSFSFDRLVKIEYSYFSYAYFTSDFKYSLRSSLHALHTYFIIQLQHTNFKSEKI